MNIKKIITLLLLTCFSFHISGHVVPMDTILKKASKEKIKNTSLFTGAKRSQVIEWKKGREQRRRVIREEEIAGKKVEIVVNTGNIYGQISAHNRKVEMNVVINGRIITKTVELPEKYQTAIKEGNLKILNDKIQINTEKELLLLGGGEKNKKKRYDPNKMYISEEGNDDYYPDDDSDKDYNPDDEDAEYDEDDEDDEDIQMVDEKDNIFSGGYNTDKMLEDEDEDRNNEYMKEKVASLLTSRRLTKRMLQSQNDITWENLRIKDKYNNGWAHFIVNYYNNNVQNLNENKKFLLNYLIFIGYNIKQANNNNETCLAFAQKNNDCDMIRYLKQKFQEQEFHPTNQGVQQEIPQNKKPERQNRKRKRSQKASESSSIPSDKEEDNDDEHSPKRRKKNNEVFMSNTIKQLMSITRWKREHGDDLMKTKIINDNVVDVDEKKHDWIYHILTYKDPKGPQRDNGLINRKITIIKHMVNLGFKLDVNACLKLIPKTQRKLKNFFNSFKNNDSKPINMQKTVNFLMEMKVWGDTRGDRILEDTIKQEHIDLTHQGKGWAHLIVEYEDENDKIRNAGLIRRKIRIVEYLIKELDYDISKKDSNGKDCLYYVAQNQPQLKEYLIWAIDQRDKDFGNEDSNINMESKVNDLMNMKSWKDGAGLKELKKIIKRQEVNRKDLKTGNTWVHYVVRFQDRINLTRNASLVQRKKNIIKYLIGLGFNMNCRNRKGETLIDIAPEKQKKLKEYLKNYITIKNKKVDEKEMRFTDMDSVVDHIMKLKNWKNDEGAKQLENLINNNNIHHVNSEGNGWGQLFIMYKDPNIRRNSALISRKIIILKYLIKCSYDPNKKNNKKKTCFDYIGDNEASLRDYLGRYRKHRQKMDNDEYKFEEEEEEERYDGYEIVNEYEVRQKKVISENIYKFLWNNNVEQIQTIFEDENLEIEKNLFEHVIALMFFRLNNLNNNDNKDAIIESYRRILEIFFQYDPYCFKNLPHVEREEVEDALEVKMLCEIPSPFANDEARTLNLRQKITVTFADYRSFFELDEDKSIFEKEYILYAFIKEVLGAEKRFKWSEFLDGYLSIEDSIQKIQNIRCMANTNNTFDSYLLSDKEANIENYIAEIEKNLVNILNILNKNFEEELDFYDIIKIFNIRFADCDNIIKQILDLSQQEHGINIELLLGNVDNDIIDNIIDEQGKTLIHHIVSNINNDQFNHQLSNQYSQFNYCFYNPFCDNSSFMDMDDDQGEQNLGFDITYKPENLLIFLLKKGVKIVPDELFENAYTFLPHISFDEIETIDYDKDIFGHLFLEYEIMLEKFGLDEYEIQDIFNRRHGDLGNKICKLIEIDGRIQNRIQNINNLVADLNECNQVINKIQEILEDEDGLPNRYWIAARILLNLNNINQAISQSRVWPQGVYKLIMMKGGLVIKINNRFLDDSRIEVINWPLIDVSDTVVKRIFNIITSIKWKYIIPNCQALESFIRMINAQVIKINRNDDIYFLTDTLTYAA